MQAECRPIVVVFYSNNNNKAQDIVNECCLFSGACCEGRAPRFPYHPGKTAPRFPNDRPKVTSFPESGGFISRIAQMVGFPVVRG
jgi:hypothetical protein